MASAHRTNERRRTAMSNWRHSKKAKQTSSQTLPSSRYPSPSPNPMPHAHFGSKASFLRCDLQTLNYSRSYRKRRRKKRKESFAQRPNERTNWRTKLSIDQWKYSHSGDRQPGREGGQDRPDTHDVTYILCRCRLLRLRETAA